MFDIVDPETGERVTRASFLSRDSAQRLIDAWKDRALRGERVDVPFEVVNRLIVVEHT
jgi:hypothetical protein